MKCADPYMKIMFLTPTLYGTENGGQVPQKLFARNFLKCAYLHKNYISILHASPREWWLEMYFCADLQISYEGVLCIEVLYTHIYVHFSLFAIES